MRGLAPGSSSYVKVATSAALDHKFVRPEPRVPTDWHKGCPVWYLQKSHALGRTRVSLLPDMGNHALRAFITCKRVALRVLLLTSIAACGHVVETVEPESQAHPQAEGVGTARQIGRTCG